MRGTWVVFGLLALPVATQAQTFNFRTASLYSAQNGPLASATADLNGDGKLDFAVGNGASSSVSIFTGKGDGTFTVGAIVPVPNRCLVSYLAPGDFNGDGKLDLLAACGLQSTVWVLPGLGNGQFGTPIATPVPQVILMGFAEASLQAVAVADFNGDGKLDLVVGVANNDLSSPSLVLMLGKGDGTFGSPASLLSAVPTSVIAADVDRDGKQDLVVMSFQGLDITNSTLTILRGNGQGSFQTAATYALPIAAAIGAMQVTDVTGDGIPDILMGGAASSSVGSDSPTSLLTVYSGKGDGTFKSGASYAEPGLVVGLLAADFRGTGASDLVAEVLTSNGDSAQVNLEVRAGNKDGTFGSAAPLAGVQSLQPWWFTLMSRDWNGDGLADLAFVSLDVVGPLGHFNSSGDGLGAAVPFFQGLGFGSLAVLLNGNTPSNTPVITSVVNGASFLPGFEAGSWMTIKGTNLANTNPGRTWRPDEVVGGILPKSLDGVSVTVDGRSAYVYYISPTQLNVQAPSDPATGNVNVVVNNNGLISAGAPGQLQAFAPAFFEYGSNVAIATRFPDNALIGDPSTVPGTVAAKPGDVLILWATGFGATNPPNSAGIAVVGAPSTAVAPLVTVGGVSATVLGTALSPGSAGLYQVAIQLPPTLPSGAVTIQASVGGVLSPDGVVIFIGK